MAVRVAVVRAAVVIAMAMVAAEARAEEVSEEAVRVAVVRVVVVVVVAAVATTASTAPLRKVGAATMQNCNRGEWLAPHGSMSSCHRMYTLASFSHSWRQVGYSAT